jgi:hypothetical protein
MFLLLLGTERINAYYKDPSKFNIPDTKAYFEEFHDWYDKEFPSYDLMNFDFITPFRKYLINHPIPNNGNELFFSKYPTYQKINLRNDESRKTSSL